MSNKVYSNFLLNVVLRIHRTTWDSAAARNVTVFKGTYEYKCRQITTNIYAGR